MYLSSALIPTVQKRGHPIVLGLLAFFSFVLMIQSAVLVSSYNRHNDYPSSSLKDR